MVSIENLSCQLTDRYTNTCQIVKAEAHPFCFGCENLVIVHSRLFEPLYHETEIIIYFEQFVIVENLALFIWQCLK